MQNIDRVSMIVAAVIVLGGIVFAHTLKDEGQMSEEKIRAAREAIDDKLNEQRIALDPAPRPQDEVAQFFQVSADASYAEWLHYRRPAYLLIEQEAERVLPKHEAPWLSEVKVEPSPEKGRFIFQIMYREGKNENVKPPSLALEAREGPEGEWMAVADAAVAGGSIAVDQSEDVRPGRAYSFRIRSQTEASSNVALAADRADLYSEPSEPVLLQPNELMAALSVVKETVGEQRVIPGRCTIERRWWDFAAGKREKATTVVNDPRVTNPVDLWDTPWQVRQIAEHPESGKPAVQLYNGKLHYSDRKVWLGSGRRPEGWDFALASWKAPEPEEGTDEEEANMPEKPADAATGASGEDTGSGLFDDEDD